MIFKHKNSYLSESKRAVFCFFLFAVSVLAGCSVITLPVDVVKGVVTTCVFVVKGTYELTAGTTKIVYKIGELTYEVIKSPADAPLTHEEIDSMAGMSVREAIRLGRVKNTPYTVNGRTYYPMSADKAESYTETGTASWYGYETLNKGGYMTANGELFSPEGMTAAHKYLPLPYHIKVTNLENGRELIVRVNDRGPFPTDQNPSAGERIIDLSMGAAKRLGFLEKGSATVRLEAIKLQEDRTQTNWTKGGYDACL